MLIRMYFKNVFQYFSNTPPSSLANSSPEQSGMKKGDFIFQPCIPPWFSDPYHGLSHVIQAIIVGHDFGLCQTIEMTL